MFKFLFSPIRLGKVEVPKRICFSAHTTNFEFDQFHPDESSKRVFRIDLIGDGL